MVGNDDAGHLSASRKMFWRSASWSSSRTAAGNASSGETEKGFADSGAADGTHGQNRRFGPPPLTPRSQQNCKARSCLPPLQPLSIARRSLDEWPKAGSDDIGEWPQPPTTPGGRGNGSNGERLKLDLSSIQHNNPDHSRSNNGNGLVKRDKIAFFDKECSKVADHVYLGGDAVARDRDILKHNGITHVLNCVGFVCPEYFKADFVYRTLWLQDSPSEDITSILYDVFDYFEDVREQGGRVFVHCCQGVSRSTSLVIAYLMWREGQSFDDAFQFVKAARGIADPNMGFACQLLQCQKRVHAVPLSPSSLLRMYRIAPHSPYDPLHLVPKMLVDPSLAALDSRGAFIVHIPSAIYVWVGKNCEATMERDARGAVGQIVRYEKVQGPIVMIKEGEEPVYFWDAFSDFLPLMDKSGKSGSRIEDGKLFVLPGKRRVDAYNVDYEVFTKAITGGFVPPFGSSGEHETHLPARESSWSVRRKVSHGNMKEVVTVPRLSFPRVYSDSMLCLRTSANAILSPSSSLSSSSSSISSSSSPSFVSPDSITSDSSIHSKFLLEVSPDSSSLSNFSSLSITSNSTSHNFSSLSITSNSTSQPVSHSTDILGVKLSHPLFQSASLPLKKPSTSLAERRGSLSKILMLPLMNDKTQVTDKSDKSTTSHASQESDILVNDNVSYQQQSDSKDYFCGSNNHAKDGGVNSIQKCEPSIADSMHLKESSLSQSTTLKGTNDSGLLQYNVAQTSVYHWPSIEKIETFGASHLDSKSAFVIFSPSMHVHAGNILYIWVGRSFSCDASQVHLDIDKQSDVGAVDWNQIGCDLLARFSLPKNSVIKVVKENEEPSEFLALLSSL
ncbi:protein-tyrosine-phosphatase MKP1-like isoform X1 [Glycine soja]|uniref:Protein-tyrosine-phosphatase MKP1 n=1 Tax=Glycine soja TaxID=3848 RepID=A0A445FYW8_GLYSO|nr:protein-tyrosine-phosphatase MKP1-like isoform X1 [Glycine soja]RZB54135.1 Protein-tyrosine-phosphatase MKP1 [Glycine soja]